MKPIIFFISYFLLISNNYAQDLFKINLKSAPSSELFQTGVRPTYIDKTVKVKKTPTTIKGDYLIKYINFSYTKAGDGLQKKDTISTSERTYFLVGKNELGDIIVIPDLNHDLDFTNDNILKYDRIRTKENIDRLPFIQIPVVVENVPTTYIIRPYPYSTAFKYNDPIEQSNYLLIESFQQQEGEFVLDNKKYGVFLHNKRPSPFFDDINTMEIAILNGESLKIFQYNEIINLDGTKFIASGVKLDGTQLLFRKINVSESSSGYTEGLNLSQINLIDIYQKEITFPAKDKFTLIDFWGTWCLPCIALTNDLKRINKAYLSKLRLVSIAFDSDVDRVKKYVSSHNMLWNHIFQSDKSKKGGLIEQFNIVEYPTFILTDKSGKIIVRSSGAEGLKQIEGILKGHNN